MLDAPQGQAWWFIAGDAIHRATENLDREGVNDPGRGYAEFDRIWQESIQRLRDEGVDFTKIKSGGRASKQWPNKENYEFWLLTGGKMVADYVDWRVNAFAQGWQWYILEDGSPSIEVPINMTFLKDTGNEVTVKGYIDRVMVSPGGELYVRDLKSGSREPASSLQLGIYALGMQEQHGVRPSMGDYYMTRKAGTTQAVSLLHYTREVVGDWFAAARRGIEAEVFIPHVGPFCQSCAVSPYCTAVGGNPAPLLSKKSEQALNV